MMLRCFNLGHFIKCGRWIPMGMLFCGAYLGLSGCTSKDKSMPQSTGELFFEKTQLDRILEATDKPTRNRALKDHGPVSDREFSYIVRRSKEASPTLQRNAMWLLKTARGSEDVLRQRLGEPIDAEAFVIGLGGLLPRPGTPKNPQAQALARSHHTLITQALASNEPDVLEAALRASVLAGDPTLPKFLAAALMNQEQQVRETAVELLAENENAAAYEAQLRTLLRERLPLLDYTSLYQCLVRSEDPSTATVIKQSLKTPRKDELRNFGNAVLLSKSRQPWLRDLLLEMLDWDDEQADTAFSRLESLGQESGFGPSVHPALVKKCLEKLETAPPPESLDRYRYLVDLDPCRSFLARLAGRDRFAPADAAAAIEFARTFLSHSRPN
jgi:hypothetical protein